MKTHRLLVSRGLLASAALAMALAVPALRAADAAPVVAQPAVNDPVTVTDNGETWTMNNGIVDIIISKKNGSMLSAIYRHFETLRPTIWTVPDTYHSPPTPANMSSR